MLSGRQTALRVVINLNYRASDILVNEGNFINPLMGTLKPQSIILQYGDWYTGRWWVDCYI